MRDAASRRLRAAAAGALLVLAACQSYPLGMSEEEWARLTPEQQLAARMQQSEVNRANAERFAQAQAAERERQAMLQAEERERLESLYQEARYGDILECVVEGGVADFHPGWRAYSPAPFTVARGERKQVPLADGGRQQGRFWASYSQDGREISICYRDPQSRRGERCASVNGMFRDFSAGVRRQITAPDVFQNANLMCAYRPGPGMPHVVRRVEVQRVIEHHHHHTRVVARPPVVVRERVVVEERDRSGRQRPHGDGDRQDHWTRERVVRGVHPAEPAPPRQSAGTGAAHEPRPGVQPAPTQPATVPTAAPNEQTPSAQTPGAQSTAAPAHEGKPRKAHKPHPPMPPQSQAAQHAAPNSAVHRQAPAQPAAQAASEDAKKGKGKGHAKRKPKDDEQAPGDGAETPKKP
jgi:hypothetical protein